MVDLDVLRWLRVEFATASWAFWSVDYPRRGCIEEDPARLVEFIEARAHRLKPWVVLLDLKGQRPRPDDFGNFHSTSARDHDFALRIFVEEAGLDGAFMTTLSAPAVIEAGGAPSADYLLRQLDLLYEDHYHVICFGTRTFDAVRSRFDGTASTVEGGVTRYSTEAEQYAIDFYAVYHYGQPTGEHVERLRDQLVALADGPIPLEAP